MLWNKKHIYCLKWSTFDEISDQLCVRLQDENYTPEFVVIIARGGMALGLKLLHHFNLNNFGTIHLKRNSSSILYPERSTPLIYETNLKNIQGFHTLIVDDIAGTGSTLNVAINIVKKFKPSSIKTLTLAINKKCQFIPDLFGIKVNDWVLFPWEDRRLLETRPEGVDVVNI